MLQKITSVSLGLDAPREPARLPNGRSVNDLKRGELHRALADLNIPEIAPDHGKMDLIAAYEAHLQSIANEAGQRAIKEWKASQ